MSVIRDDNKQYLICDGDCGEKIELEDYLDILTKKRELGWKGRYVKETKTWEDYCIGCWIERKR